MGNCNSTIDILTLNGCYVGDNIKTLEFLNYNVLAIVENGKVLGQLDLSEYKEVVDEFSLNPIKIGAGETRTLPFNPNSTGVNYEITAFYLDNFLFGYDVPPTRIQNDVGADFVVDSVITDITCNKINEYGNNEATGSIVATATEPSATYVWTDSNFNEIGTTNTLTGLVPGIYTALISSDSFPDMTINVSVLESAINNEIEIEFKTSTDVGPDFPVMSVKQTFNTNYYIDDVCSFSDFITALNQYFDAEPYDDNGTAVTPEILTLSVAEVDETTQSFTIKDLTTGESVWYHITGTLKGGNFEQTSGEVISNISTFDFSTFDWTSIGTNKVVIEMYITEDPNIPLMFDTSFYDTDIISFTELTNSISAFIAGGSYTDAYGIVQTPNVGDYITIEIDVGAGTFELHSVATASYSFTITPDLNVVEQPFDVIGVSDIQRITTLIPAYRYITGSIKTAFIIAEFCSECSSAVYEWAYALNPCNGSTTDLLWQTAGSMLSLSGSEDLLITDVNRIPPIVVRNIQNCDIWLDVIIVQ